MKPTVLRGYRSVCFLLPPYFSLCVKQECCRKECEVILLCILRCERLGDFTPFDSYREHLQGNYSTTAFFNYFFYFYIYSTHEYLHFMKEIFKELKNILTSNEKISLVELITCMWWPLLLTLRGWCKNCETKETVDYGSHFFMTITETQRMGAIKYFLKTEYGQC